MIEIIGERRTVRHHYKVTLGDNWSFSIPYEVCLVVDGYSPIGYRRVFRDKTDALSHADAMVERMNRL